ncbi:YrhB domain-containing protein [Micromonospora auratinigra]|uniref:Immunity protein 35 n=1 Tax=Micromonospora auratinigra TaxID=261654 RepID=A0A1A8Z9F1_9ACTN|nr:YrhB domain-containing protein [Micromonospora auratinigra]SBT40432.1 Immunity protein 35 [Micromonospora auratinigra]
MVTKEQAVALVTALLAEERRTGRLGPAIEELAVLDVERHPLGWLVFWQSARYVRTRDVRDMLIGQGPYLVDGEDGSIHHVPVTKLMTDDWEIRYRWQVRGEPRPDPVRDDVRAVLRDEGSLPAMRHLRRRCPALSPFDARAYVYALRDGGEPPADLVRRTRPPGEEDRMPVTQRRAGPCR